MWHFLQTVQCSDVIQCIYGRWQASMKTENLEGEEYLSINRTYKNLSLIIDICIHHTFLFLTNTFIYNFRWATLNSIKHKVLYFSVHIYTHIYHICETNPRVFSPESLPRQWGGGNRIGLWRTSTRWRYHTSLGTRHRSRTLVWSVCSRGSLWGLWCAPGNVPETRAQNRTEQSCMLTGFLISWFQSNVWGLCNAANWTYLKCN